MDEIFNELDPEKAKLVKQAVFAYDYVFPDYVLPNALSMDHAWLNFINSKNVIQHHGRSFTTPSLHSQKGFMENLYGRYVWPCSMEDTNITADSFNQLIKIKVMSVHEARKQQLTYVYPIKIPPHLDDWISVNPTHAERPGQYFHNNISETVRRDIKEKRATVFIDMGQENFVSKEQYEDMHTMLKHAKFPPEQVIFSFNTFNGKEIYENWFTPEERMMKVVNWPFVLTHSSYWFKSRSLTQEQIVEHSTQAGHRPYHFLFNIRNTRPYRQHLLLNFARKNLLWKCNWSYLKGDTLISQEQLEENRTYFPCDDRLFNLEKFNEELPKTLNEEQTSTYENVSAWTDLNFSIYLSSYFYLCTETYMDRDGHKSITEKISKPLANMQPFLFASFPGALQFLRELGFKTFDGFIDESYDLETDATKRMIMIGNEVERLCSMTKQEIHDWYWSQWDILQHNQHTLKMFWKTYPSVEDEHSLCSILHARSKNYG